MTDLSPIHPGPAAIERRSMPTSPPAHRLGHDITRSGLYAALHQPGVQNVQLISPAADIVVGPAEAAYCTSVAVSVGGRDV